jgi:DNA-binding PucR family transcriptional regulator
MYVEQSYREALDLLHMKKRFPVALGNEFNYQNTGYYMYLPLIQKQKRSPYHSGAIQKLRKYDYEHSGCLLDTLQLFLELDSSIKDTAEALHVHINTLNYRLKRISEITEIDLKNMDQKVTLYLELKLEKLLL